MFDEVHIGREIKKVMRQQKCSIPKLARKLGLADTGVRRALKKPFLRVEMLMKISEELNYNFFRFYTADLINDKAQLEEQLEQKDKELLKLGEKISEMNVKQMHQQEIIDMLKEITGNRGPSA